jgi:hypothetical protein
VVATQLTSQRLEALDPAGDERDSVAAGRKLAGELLSDATRRAGHQRRDRGRDRPGHVQSSGF